MPNPAYIENVMDLRNFSVSVFFVQCINTQDDHARPTYLPTYLLTPWRRVLLEKLTGSAASQEIPRILNPKVHYHIHK